MRSPLTWVPHPLPVLQRVGLLTLRSGSLSRRTKIPNPEGALSMTHALPTLCKVSKGWGTQTRSVCAGHRKTSNPVRRHERGGVSGSLSRCTKIQNPDGAVSITHALPTLCKVSKGWGTQTRSVRAGHRKNSTPLCRRERFKASTRERVSVSGRSARSGEISTRASGACGARSILRWRRFSASARSAAATG